MKHLGDEKVGAGTLLTNGGRNGGAVPESIDEVGWRITKDERRATVHASDVWMVGMNAAVENRDRDAAAGATGERLTAERMAHAAASVHRLERATGEQSGE